MSTILTTAASPSSGPGAGPRHRGRRAPRPVAPGGGRLGDAGQAAIVLVVAITVLLTTVGGVMVTNIVNNDPILTQANIQRYAYRALASGLNTYQDAINANPYLAACNTTTNGNRPVRRAELRDLEPGARHRPRATGSSPSTTSSTTPRPCIDSTTKVLTSLQVQVVGRGRVQRQGRLLLDRRQVHPGQRLPRQRLVDQLRVGRGAVELPVLVGHRIQQQRELHAGVLHRRRTPSTVRSSPTTRSSSTGSRTSARPHRTGARPPPTRAACSSTPWTAATAGRPAARTPPPTDMGNYNPVHRAATAPRTTRPSRPTTSSWAATRRPTAATTSGRPPSPSAAAGRQMKVLSPESATGRHRSTSADQHQHLPDRRHDGRPPSGQRGPLRGPEPRLQPDHRRGQPLRRLPGRLRRDRGPAPTTPRPRPPAPAATRARPRSPDTEGDVFVQGSLSGHLTISANNDVVVDGPITYADCGTWAGTAHESLCNYNSATGTTPNDVLGLIAYNYVEISRPVDSNGNVLASCNNATPVLTDPLTGPPPRSATRPPPPAAPGRPAGSPSTPRSSPSSSRSPSTTTASAASAAPSARGRSPSTARSSRTPAVPVGTFGGGGIATGLLQGLQLRPPAGPLLARPTT